MGIQEKCAEVIAFLKKCVTIVDENY